MELFNDLHALRREYTPKQLTKKLHRMVRQNTDSCIKFVKTLSPHSVVKRGNTFYVKLSNYGPEELSRRPFLLTLFNALVRIIYLNQQLIVYEYDKKYIYTLYNCIKTFKRMVCLNYIQIAYYDNYNYGSTTNDMTIFITDYTWNCRKLLLLWKKGFLKDVPKDIIIYISTYLRNSQKNIMLMKRRHI